MGGLGQDLDIFLRRQAIKVETQVGVSFILSLTIQIHTNATLTTLLTAHPVP